MRFAAAICLLVSLALASIRAIAADETCAVPASELATGSSHCTSPPKRFLIESWVSYLHSHSLVNIAHISHLVPFLTVVDESDGTPCRGATVLKLC